MKEPAFPIAYSDNMDFNLGMSLRDYFAAAALQGLCAGDVLKRWPAVAADAYNAANAMMDARQVNQTTNKKEQTR